MKLSLILGKSFVLIVAAAAGSVSGAFEASAQASASAYTTGYRYDAMGRQTGSIRPSASGAGGPYLAIRNTYDVSGRLAEVEEGWLGAWQAETVAPANWPSISNNVNGFTVSRITAYAYDSLGRKISQATADPSGTIQGITQYNYDGEGRLICTAVRMNRNVYPQIGGGGALSGGSLPASACASGGEGTGGNDFGPDRITKNNYDGAGQLLLIQKGYGTSLQQNYETYTYTLNGKQKTIADANNNLTTYSYDGFDRLIGWAFPSQTSTGVSASCAIGTVSTMTITWPDATTTEVSTPSTSLAPGDDCEKYGYDANGNKVELVKRDGSILYFEPDALNRIVYKSVPQLANVPATDTRSVFYSYDLLGHQLNARFDNVAGDGVSNIYDALGRLVATSLIMDGVSHAMRYCYDGDGNRTVIAPENTTGSCPNSTALPSGWSGAYTTYSYDGLDRPTLILRNGSNTIAAYEYNSAGYRIGFNNDQSSAQATLQTSYTYDAVGRLATFSNILPNNTAYSSTVGGPCTSGSICYNPADQIVGVTKGNSIFAFRSGYNVNRTYHVNGQNQYTSAGSAIFSYDANGNLAGDGGDSFTYDVENRLVNVNGSHTAAIRYDPLGRLYEVVGETGTTRFFYGEDELLIEYDGSGDTLRSYVHGADLKADDPIAWYEGPGYTGSNERFLRGDWQGSVTLVTDNVGQTMFAANSYDEYGIPGLANSGRFQYTGQAWIPEIGMYYYKARMYSPTLGRFMQTDPVGYKDSIDLYAYVANDPMDKVDFTGNAGGPPEADDKEESNRGLFDEIFDPAAPLREDAYRSYESELRQIRPNEPPGLRNPGPASETAVSSIRTELRGATLERAAQLERGAVSLERRATEHEAKLAEFQQNPTVRPGMQGQSPQTIANQQAARVQHLQQEIGNFRSQAAQNRAEAARLRQRADELQ